MLTKRIVWIPGSIPSLAAGLTFGGISAAAAHQTSAHPRNLWVMLGRSLWLLQINEKIDRKMYTFLTYIFSHIFSHIFYQSWEIGTQVWVGVRSKFSIHWHDNLTLGVTLGRYTTCYMIPNLSGQDGHILLLKLYFLLIPYKYNIFGCK